MALAFLWGGLAASALLVGFAISGLNLSNRILGILMGIGSGALIGAIAYELVPESALGAGPLGLAFASGALAFFAGDWLIDRRGGAKRKAVAAAQPENSGLAIFVGTLLDNVPESLVLGMGLAIGGSVSIAFLAAVTISNLPEGVAGTINMEATGYSRRRILWMWGVLVLISAACAGLGYAVVFRQPALQGGVAEAFAAGAMLTMLADAMMPEAFEHGGLTVGLFTSLGFLATAMLSSL